MPLPVFEPPIAAVVRIDASTRTSVLHLRDVVSSVDRHYPKMRGALQGVRAAGAKAEAKEGAFDPVVSLGSETLRYNSSTTRGKSITGSANALGIEWTTVEGAKIAATRILNAGGVKSPESSTGSLGTWAVELKLPLLRGSGVNDKRVSLEQARFAVPGARYDAERLRFDLRFDASIAYWSWVAAVRRLAVRERVLAIAIARAAQIGAEVEAGGRPAIDASEADAESFLREADAAKARRDAEKAALTLGKFLWNSDGSPGAIPTLERVPVHEDGPASPATIGPDAVERIVRLALERRPELAGLMLERRRIALDRRLAENDFLPSVDLVVAPGLDLGDRSIGQTLKAGVRFSAPVGRVDARGRREEAAAKDRKVELEEELVRRLVRIEIDDAASAVNRAVERLSATDRSMRRLRDVEAGERVRFREGDSTLFLLNQRERQSAEAEVRWVDALADVELARAQFRWAGFMEDEDGVG